MRKPSGWSRRSCRSARSHSVRGCAVGGLANGWQVPLAHLPKSEWSTGGDPPPNQLGDEATGNAAGDIGLHFQLAPTGADFDHANLAVNTTYQDGWNVLVRTEKQDGLKLLEEEGQVSFEYTKKEPRPAFGYHIEKESGLAGLRFITLVIPYETGKPEVKVKVVGDPQPGSSDLQLEITENAETKIIGYSLQ